MVTLTGERGKEGGREKERKKEGTERRGREKRREQTLFVAIKGVRKKNVRATGPAHHFICCQIFDVSDS